MFSYVKLNFKGGLSSRAKTLRDLDRDEEAINIAQSLLQKAKLNFGESSIRYADYLFFHSKIFREVIYEEYNFSLWKEVIRIYNLNHIDLSDNLAKTHHQLGQYYRAENDFDQAAYHLKVAEEKYLKIYGDDHLIIGSLYNSKGILFKKLKNYQQARSYYSKSLQIKESYFGIDYWRNAPTFFNIGLTYLYEGHDFQLAVTYFEKALKLLEDNNKMALSFYYHIQTSYADALIRLNQIDKAEIILNSAKQFYSEKKYKAGWSMAKINSLLVSIWIEQKKYDQAYDLLKATLPVLIEYEKPDERERVEAKKNMKLLKNLE